MMFASFESRDFVPATFSLLNPCICPCLFVMYTCIGIVTILLWKYEFVALQIRLELCFQRRSSSHGFHVVKSHYRQDWPHGKLLALRLLRSDTLHQSVWNLPRWAYRRCMDLWAQKLQIRSL